jgi:hypothetical protein
LLLANVLKFIINYFIVLSGTWRSLLDGIKIGNYLLMILSTNLLVLLLGFQSKFKENILKLVFNLQLIK